MVKRFKISRVNGEKYLQIWDDNQFLMSCGSAEKLYERLVRFKELEGQTKKWSDIRTKILRDAGVESD